MRRFTLKAVALAGVLLGSALIPALAQQRGPGLVGDVNGDGRITSADALAVYAFLAGRSVPASYDIAGRGDADGDGRITRADAELIMRVAVGQPVPDRPVGKPAAPGATPADVPLSLRCIADVRAGTVTCANPTTPGGPELQSEAITYSGQHINVSLLTDNVQTVADTFAFDMRVKNLIPQAIGTTDGTTVDPVKIFFKAEPQAVGGNVTAVNHDGAQGFTVSEPQKFFSYPEIIQPQATSSVHRWKLRMDPGVSSFTFYLYVNSPVVYPRGLVDVYPSSATLTGGATLQLSDTVRSALGKPIPGAAVTWSSSNTAVATVDANGIVTAVGDGVATITASDSPRRPGTSTITVSTASVATSTITASPTSLPVHDTSSITLTLRAANGDSITHSGGTVVFSSTGGTLTGYQDNNNGTYSVRLTSPTVGLVRVSATLNGNAIADTADVTFTAGAAAAYRVTASADTVAAGGNVTITAQTVDADGNPVSTAGTTVTWSSTNGGSFATPTSTTDASGAATVVFTTSTTAGTTHTVSATDGTLSGTSGNIVTSVGAASQLVFTQQPSNVSAGSAITPPVVVQIQDANGNVVTSSSDSVTIAIANNPSSGALSGTLTVAAVNGVATFSNLSINKTGTGYTLSATSGALPAATSSAFDVTAGAASQLVLTTQPSDTAQSGASFAQQPVVQLQDANGNAVSQAGVTVTAAIATGGGTLGGTTTATTDASGVATFTDLSITGTAGDRTLSFSATGLTSAMSGTISITAGAASQLVLTTQPSSTAQSGAQFAQQPVVQLQDASGNAVAQAGVTVTAAIATGGGTLGGTTTATTDASGKATFTDLSITGTAGDRTLSFSATGVTSATSGTISITAGAASQLVLTTQPSGTAQSGAAFAQQPVVQLQDASGNAVAQAGVTVTAAIATGGGTLGGTTTATTDASGVATFTNLSITGTAGDRTLSFSATGVTSATSGTISITAGAASQLVLTTQPSSTAQSGAAFAQQPVVQLQDASGNAVAQAGVTVTAAIATGGGTLGGTTTATTDASGVATFTNLSITGTVGDRTLSFSATGVTSATSNTISITAGTASQLVLTTQPSSTAQSGASFAQQPVVQLQDASGNAVSQAGVTVTAAIATGGGTLGGTVTATTNASGTATFTNLSISGTTGDRTLSFSATGLTSATSGTITITAGAAAALTFTVQPSNVVAGAPISPAVQVSIVDASGNVVTTSTDNVTLAIGTNPAAGTLSGTTTVAAVNGVATFSDLSINRSGTGYTLAASSGALTGATSSTFNVAAGAASQLVITTQPSSTAQSGAPFAQQPVVQLRDANGNVAPQSGVTVTVAIATGGGTLGGTTTATTDGSGTATFTGLSITGTVGDRTLSFSASGVTSATSNTISITAGAASQLTITIQPSDTAQSGVAFPRQPVVQLRDASGNAVSQAGVTVTAAIPSGGTLGGTATATTNASGVATFTNLSITGTAGNRTLSFSATGVTSATSSTIVVTAGAPSQVTLTTPPSSTAQAGVAFAQQPVTQLRDASGNAVSQAGVTVTAAIASGGGTLGGTVTATTDASGVATFTNLSIGGAAGDRTLSFSATGLTSANTGTITVTAGAPAALAFTVQPSTVVASAPISPAPQLSIVDAFGNVVTTATDNVTVAIGTNPSGGTLSGTTTVAAVNGVATFSNLSINLTGTGYTLTASSGSLTGATSTAFNVTHGPLDHFLVEAAGGGPIPNQLAGTPFNVRVTAQDAFNNTVTSFTGAVNFTSTPAGGITAGATSGAFTGGVLTSHSITFGTPGAFTLTATNTAGAQSGTSNSFEVQAAPVAVNEGPAGNSTPGQPFHAFYSTAGSPQTFTLPAPGLLSNDNLGFPTATITSFGADSLGGSVTTYAAGQTVSPLPGTGRTTGSLSVAANGQVTFTPPDGFTGNYVFRYRLTNARGTSDAQVTIAVGARPAAVSDTYSPVLVGNVPVNTATSTQFRVTANDAGDGKVLAVTGQTNGTATINADSTFTFTPARGYEGTASFNYTVTNGFGTAAAATVTLTVATPVYFLNSAAAAGGDGRYTTPYNTLASFAAVNNGTGTNPAANDRIFLYSGAYAAPVTLLSGQRFVGQGATGSSFGSVLGVTWPADSGPEPTINGTSPTITSATTGMTLGSGNTLRGFNLGNITGTALAGTSFGVVTIGDVGINTTGQALSLTTGTLNGGFTQLRSTGGTNNVFLSGVATNGISTLGGAGDVLSGATGDAFVVAGGTGSFTYSGNVTQASNAATVNVSGGHTGTLRFQSGTVSATNGTGLQFNNADGNYPFDGTTTLNGGNAGIDVTNGSSGTFVFPAAASITNPTAEVITISNSAPTFTYSGTLLKNNNTNTGITLSSNTGGTLTFDGATKVLSTQSGAAVNITGNAAAVVFSDSLRITTTTGTGFNATGGGTVRVAGTHNSITSVGGVALNVDGTTIGTGGLNFRSISANGGANGIMLNNTGATAGLTVSGTGTAGTGGTIQNTSGADGAVAGNGVYLNNARDVNLSWMQLNGHANNAISGTTVTGFTLANSVISGVNGTNDSSPYNESSVRFDNLTGSSSITNTSISGGFSNNVRVYNSTGTLNRLTFTGVTVGANSTTNGNDGIGIEASGTAVMNVTVQNSTFTSARGDLFQMSVPSGTADLVFNTNTLSNNHPAIATGGGGVTITSGGTGVLTTNIAGNTMRDAVGHAVLIVKDAGTGSLSGAFNNNQIGVAGVANSGSLEGAGLKVQQAGQGTLTLAVTNNQIRQYNNEGILLQAGAGIATSGTFNVSVIGNTLANPGSNASIGNIFQGFALNNGVTPGDTFITCVNVGTNSLTGSGRNGGVDVRLRHRQITTVLLPGYVGGQYDAAAVDAYLLPRLGGAPTRSSASSGTGGGFQNTASSCT